MREHGGKKSNKVKLRDPSISNIPCCLFSICLSMLHASNESHFRITLPVPFFVHLNLILFCSCVLVVWITASSSQASYIKTTDWVHAIQCVVSSLFLLRGDSWTALNLAERAGDESQALGFKRVCTLDTFASPCEIYLGSVDSKVADLKPNKD